MEGRGQDGQEGGDGGRAGCRGKVGADVVAACRGGAPGPRGDEAVAVAEVRGSRGARGSVDARDGLIFEAGRFVVLVQVGLERKRLVTPLALEVLESRVRLHVGPKVGPVCKAFAAVGAAVGFVSGMGAHVALE